MEISPCLSRNGRNLEFSYSVFFGKMMYLYVIPSFITGIITFSWYSFYGFGFFRGGLHQAGDNSLLLSSVPKLKHDVPVYMWDIYKNGIKRSGTEGADIIRGLTPKFLGPYFSSRYYPNHGKQELQFNIPETSYEETLVEAEIRVMTNEIRALNISFQVFHKSVHWVFLDAKTVPPAGVDWISLNVTQCVKALKKASGLSFLMLTVFREMSRRYKTVKYTQPFLLLSYSSRTPATNHTNGASYFPDMEGKPRNIRRKRNLSEHYEEETNRIWESDAVAKKPQRLGNTCRRKPLFIDFSEIDFDTWIVAPTGYEAYQCVGKCTLPIGEHLSPTKHAIVQTMMHHVSPSKVARACCVPTRLDSISVLYIDSNGVLTYRLHYHDMVVAECGCR